MQLISSLAAVILAVGAAAGADDLVPGQREKIDALFAKYADSPGPGCAIGVMRNGKLSHAGGYGLADVERRVSITPATLFDIGSTSKQFTAAAVILLEIDGKLALSDDVRKYLPELPDFGTPITIDHLLRHTSGLRDYTALLALAGVEVESVSGDEQALAVLARQRKLNFPTGSRYEYSNSGYFLLSLIVQRVSGKSLAEFTRDRIFLPLGMNSARFRDKHAEIIPGRALGYAAGGEANGAMQFNNALSNWEQTGDGALHLSIEDALKWDENFYQPRVGGAALVERLQQVGRLDNGEPIGYARGLFIDKYRGTHRVQHAGNWVGYNATLARFPQQHTSIAIFCNFEGGEASALADQVADIVLVDVLAPAASAQPQKTVASKRGAIKSVPRQRFIGSYFAANTESILEVQEAQGALVLKIGPTALPLTAVGPASFVAENYPVTVDFPMVGKQPAHELQLRIGNDEMRVATRFPPAAPSTQELQTYTGTFYSPELDVTWPLVIDAGHLAIHHETRKFAVKIEPLTPAMADAFSGEAGFIRFTRDTAGKVSGFDLSSSRMRGIRFDLRPGNGAVASQAQIRTTSYGVPHVLADDFEGVGFGLGYAFAQTDICEIASRWVTVNAARSRYFGPDEPSADAYASGAEPFTNVQSDFFWQSVLDRDLVGRELAANPPLGPTSEVRDIVRGYAAGYNHYLAETGVDDIPDARCRGAEWVRPITEQDVYLRALHWSMFLSSGGFMQEYLKAAPPVSGAGKSSSRSKRPSSDDGPGAARQSQGPGSNMIALGKDATDNGRGMLFANPHWLWHGPERWFEAQLTVPGKLNVYGGGLLGVPIMLFGHTDNVAWSHTLATPRRFTIYQLRLAPRSATSYLYDGEVRPMSPRTVTVDVRRADGGLEKRSHTFWETHYGMVLQSNDFAWTGESAYAVRDVALNLRWLNQQMEMNRAQSVEQLDQAGRRYLGIGWLNTMAADSAGNTYFADRTSVPHVSKDQLDKCIASEIGRRMLAGRQMVLDGSRSECGWGSDADSVVPGTFGTAALPQLMRTDYVTNSNDSYWTNNLRQPLEGYPLIIGDERTPRSLRTRMGLLKIERRLNGTDGYPGKRFTLDQLEAITMDNRVLSAELWRDPLVSLCRRMPAKAGLPTACDVLARWDLTENLDSPGAVLWRRFFENLDAKARQEVFAIPFDAADPMNTPSGLNTDDPRVATALTTAIADLLNSNVPLDASYRDYQYDTRGAVRIAMHGGLSDSGQYNFMHNKSGWVPGKGWPEMFLGSTFIMWMQFTDQGPKGRSVMTYSQSSNPSSPHYLDQSLLYSEKKSKPILFDERAILADPNLKVTRVCAPAKSFQCARFLSTATPAGTE